MYVMARPKTCVVSIKLHRITSHYIASLRITLVYWFWRSEFLFLPPFSFRSIPKHTCIIIIIIVIKSHTTKGSFSIDCGTLVHSKLQKERNVMIIVGMKSRRFRMLPRGDVFLIRGRPSKFMRNCSFSGNEIFIVSNRDRKIP